MLTPGSVYWRRYPRRPARRAAGKNPPCHRSGTEFRGRSIRRKITKSLPSRPARSRLLARPLIESTHRHRSLRLPFRHGTHAAICLPRLVRCLPKTLSKNPAPVCSASGIETRDRNRACLQGLYAPGLFGYGLFLEGLQSHVWRADIGHVEPAVTIRAYRPQWGKGTQQTQSFHRSSASVSECLASTQRSPAAVFSFFQNGDRVFR